MKSKQRDFQRQKVYDTEKSHSLWEQPIFDNKKWRFADCENSLTIHEVREFVESIELQSWFMMAFGHVNQIIVSDGRGRKRAAGWHASWGYQGIGEISIPRWARHRLVILHEMAHVVTHHIHSSHGQEFCENFLFLIYFVIGQKAGNEMEKLFIKNKVKY